MTITVRVFTLLIQIHTEMPETNSITANTLRIALVCDVIVVDCQSSAGGRTDAVAGVDFATKVGDITIAAGQTSVLIPVKIFGDLSVEAAIESFNFNLSDLQDAIFDTDGTIPVAITDDDPSFTISNATVTEGNSGTVTAVFTVTLSSAPTREIKV